MADGDGDGDGAIAMHEEVSIDEEDDSGGRAREEEMMPSSLLKTVEVAASQNLKTKI